MYLVSWGAVRRRTGQTVVVLALAALAATAAAAAPWYALATASRAAEAHIDAAPAVQRVFTAHRTGDTGGDPRATLDTFAATVTGLLRLPGATPRLGLAADMRYTDPRRANAVTGLPIAYRDGFCEHVRVSGTCPATTGEVAVSATSARTLTLRVGSAITILPTDATTPVPVRVTAIYERLDPVGEYWADPLYLARGDQDPLFTSLDTFRQAALARPVLGYDVALPPPLLRGDNGFDLRGVLGTAKADLAAGQIQTADPTGPLLGAVRAGRGEVRRGVLIALGLVTLLAWFALGLAGRFTGRDRRSDAGLLKLRGSTRGGVLRLTAGQHLVPLLGGAAVGLPAGVLAAGLLAGRLPVRAEWLPALLLSLGLVAAVLAGGLIALTVVDALAYRAPVVALLRRVPSVRHDWRSAVVDAAFVALAAGAVVQARQSGASAGLGAAAPALVALAVGLVLARVLRSVADRAGGAAVRAGRLRAGLTAVQLSRQPGADRVFALIVVAVAMLALAAGGLVAGRAERADRAQVELGAPRVLTVAASSRTQLLYAVRTADPTGRHAMAVAVDTSANPPVLAVDTPRLAAIATWRPEYGPRPAPVPAPATPLITGDRIVLEVTSSRAVASAFGVILQHEGTGAVLRVDLGPIRPGAGTVSAAVPVCATAPGCRLVSWQLFPSPGPDGRPIRGAVTLHGLSQQNPSATIFDRAALTDVTRWRTDFTDLAVRVKTGPDGLSLAAGSAPDRAAGTGVYAADVPLPLSVVLAGARPTTWRFDDASSPSFGSAAAPIRVAGTAPALPVLGRSGMLADLDQSRRLGAEGGAFQVWLSADAPAGLRATLERSGLTVLSDRGESSRAAALAAQENVITAPFALFTVAIAALLAAAMVAVSAAVERGPQTEQLRALRAQGLSRRDALATGYGSGAALVLTGVAGGVLAALIAAPVAGVTAPPFADGWNVLPPPGALGPLAVLLAALSAFLVLGLTAWLSARPVARSLRPRSLRPHSLSSRRDVR